MTRLRTKPRGKDRVGKFGLVISMLVLGSFLVVPSGALAITPHPDGMDFPTCMGLAKAGDAAAQTDLGVMYATGTGVERDFAKAMEWYLKAAEQGSGMAMANLANMYFQGEGVPRDAAKAAEWNLKAAEHDNIKGQVNIGVMYYQGTGVAKDMVLAHKWINIARVRGFPKGRTFLTKLEREMTDAQIKRAWSAAEVELERLDML